MNYYKLTLKLSKHKDHDLIYYYSSKNTLNKDSDEINELVSDISSRMNTQFKLISIESIDQNKYYNMK